jgi:hypothetical protein
MEIYLDKRAVKQIRMSASDAIDEGDNETLREDIHEAFTDDQVDEIERRIDSGDFYDFLSEIISEWGGDDIDELFEILEAHLADAGVDLKYSAAELSDDEDDGEDMMDDDDDDLTIVDESDDDDI